MGLYFTDEKAKAKRVTAQATHTEPISEPRWKDSRIYTHNHRTILPPTLQEILGVGYARMRLVMKEYTVSIQKMLPDEANSAKVTASHLLRFRMATSVNTKMTRID